MRKLLNNPWVVAALALAAAAFVGQTLLTRRGSAGAAVPDPAPVAETEPAGDGPAAAGPGAPRTADELAAQTFPTARRDPFAPGEKAVAARAIGANAPAAPDFIDTVHLSAVWSQDGASYVLLNGIICRPGDEIGRLRIESASTDGVWLTHWKGRDHLAIGEDFTLTTPANAPTVPATIP